MLPTYIKGVRNYRELVAKLESNLEAVEGYNQVDECTKLQKEIDRLKGELEHRALKGDFNCDAKVLHFAMNPAAIAEKQAEEKQMALIREVEELRAKLVQGGANTTASSSLQTQGNYFTCIIVYRHFIRKYFIFRNSGTQADPRNKDSSFEGRLQGIISRIPTSMLSIVRVEGG